MALGLVEAGARAVYCVDLPARPSAEWETVRDYAARMEGRPGSVFGQSAAGSERAHG